MNLTSRLEKLEQLTAPETEAMSFNLDELYFYHFIKIEQYGDDPRGLRGIGLKLFELRKREPLLMDKLFSAWLKYHSEKHGGNGKHKLFTQTKDQ